MSDRKLSAAILFFHRTLIFAGLLSLANNLAFAKPPTLSRLFPPGAPHGQTVAVTATGSFDRWPVKAWAAGSGLTITAGSEKGKLSVRVAEDAEPGVRWVRLYDEEGATDLRPFIIGTLPEVLEVEPNDDPNRPQAISPSCVTVNGRLARSGDVDGFSVSLTKGQTLVADLEANRHLGAPMDGVLQLVTASGFVLAQNDDAVGRDPRIVFQAPAAGTYLVRVFAFPSTPDSSIRFAGGEAFVYRLTLTTAGFLDYAFPLANFCDGRSSVRAIGANLPEWANSLYGSYRAAEPAIFHVSHPLLAGTAEVLCVPEQVLIEVEPNDFAHPQGIPAPAAVSGQIDPRGDRDCYRLVLNKGETRLIRVESRLFGLPLDGVVKIFDKDGKALAEADDQNEKRDPELTFTAPRDDEYRVVVRDLNGGGGPRYAYLLRVLIPEPDFSISLATDRYEATTGKASKVTVKVERKAGLSARIEINAEDLPPGVTSRPMISRLGDDSSKTVTLELQVPSQAPSGVFRVIGRTQSGSLRVHTASVNIAGFATKTDHPWLTIRPFQPSAPASKN